MRRADLEILAADFDGHPSAVVAAHAARHQAVDLVVAAAGIGAHDDARNARQLPPQIERDLIAGALAFVLRDEEELDEAAARSAAAEAAAAAAAADPALAMIVSRLGHELPDHLLEPRHDGVGPLDARAGGELGGHRDHAFVGLRRELGVEQREHQHRRDHRQHTCANDHRPMGERLMQKPPIRVIHPIEESFARREELSAESLALFGRERQLEQMRAEHRHERDARRAAT